VGKKVWFIPYDISVALRRDLQFSSLQPSVFFFFFLFLFLFLSTFIFLPSFLLQQHQPPSYTPPYTMVLAIYSSL
jgi:hypothetical protein